jgi:ATP-dependent helicase/nuclease subunit B
MKGLGRNTIPLSMNLNTTPLSPTLVYLGWGKPWPVLFADWLHREPDRLRRRLVVVPSRESGRRLRECLVKRAGGLAGGAILGPRMATPDDIFRPSSTLPDAIRWAGWLTVLRDTSGETVSTLFPSGLADKDDAWRLGVVRQIENARESLIAGNADFSLVAAKLAEDATRWTELAQLEERVISVWQKWGHSDPVRAKQVLARNPVLPQGVDEIIVAGVSDPTALAVQAWRALAERGVPITVLIGAPESMQGGFDAWGRPTPEYWAHRGKHSTPEPTVSIVAADAGALATAVVASCAGKSNLEVAVGVCDSTYIPAVERQFREAGWTTFDPKKVPPPKDGLPELLEALADASASPTVHAAIARVARHPVVWKAYFNGSNIEAAFAALDVWEVDNAATNIAPTIEGLAQDHSRAENAAGALLAKARKLAVDAASAEGAEAFTLELRTWLEASAQEIAIAALAEMQAWPTLRAERLELPTLLRWLAISLAAVLRSGETADGVLALQGWLELPFDPAPHLILAGLHEGIVPEAPAASPLISQAVGERLGLRDRRSRLACEAFLYTAMVEGRRAAGSVTVITALIDAKGDPCKPSRVLLQAPTEALSARVLQYVTDKPDVPLQPTPPWARGEWKLRPPLGIQANKAWTHFSPSTIKTYLACPTRFYFAKVLGWDKFEAFKGELDAARFGDLIHLVLSEWGQDSTARDFAETAQLEEYWLCLLERQTTARFGADIPPLLRLQIMSAQERLRALAPKQAEQCRSGWSVIEVEKELNGVLTLAGLPVNMKIDRIDKHDDGRLRVVDYKTGATATNPFKAHLQAVPAEKNPAALGPLWIVEGQGNAKDKQYRWTDLQLPLYAAAVQKKWGLEKTPEAYYAQLPAAIGDTTFELFEGFGDTIENALLWAEEAAKRIQNGVFWPPAPEMKYDDLAALAPEGLEQALGEEWKNLLSGTRIGKGGEVL